MVVVLLILILCLVVMVFVIAFVVPFLKSHPSCEFLGFGTIGVEVSTSARRVSASFLPPPNNEPNILFLAG